jgi:hypothetical protein
VADQACKAKIVLAYQGGLFVASKGTRQVVRGPFGSQMPLTTRFAGFQGLD